MPQLVGRACIHCQQPITRVTDGDFCATCDSPAHTACVASAHARQTPGACPGCGAPPAVAAVNRRGRRERERAGRTTGQYVAGGGAVFAGLYALYSLGRVAVLAADKSGESDSQVWGAGINFLFWFVIFLAAVFAMIRSGR